MNPRHSLPFDGKLVNRHRIIRRGITYGEPLPEGAEDDGRERGVIFMCLQASVAREFEFVQSQWANGGNAFRLAQDQDADRRPARHRRPVEDDVPGTRRSSSGPLSRVVTTRGGEYYFTPGINGLRHLAGCRRSLDCGPRGGGGAAHRAHPLHFPVKPPRRSRPSRVPCTRTTPLPDEVYARVEPEARRGGPRIRRARGDRTIGVAGRPADSPTSRRSSRRRRCARSRGSEFFELVRSTAIVEIYSDARTWAASATRVCRSTWAATSTAASTISTGCPTGRRRHDPRSTTTTPTSSRSSAPAPAAARWPASCATRA